MDKKPVKHFVEDGQLSIGKPLPWPVFDQRGGLLLRENTLISSEKQIDTLMRLRAHYYEGPRQSVYQPEKSELARKVSSFKVINTLLSRLEQSFGLLESTTRGDEFVRSIIQRVMEIQSVCADQSSAALGTIQLMVRAPVKLTHSLHTALICEVASAQMGWGVMDRIPLVAAALTQNIGMREIQQLLFEQTEPLSQQQRARVNSHPKDSAEILKQRGVTDQRWIAAVEQHHERLDGTGYPLGLTRDEISTEAKLLAIADTYVAMTQPREYRQPVKSRAALKEILSKRGESIDAALSKLFIEVMGIFTPGTLVKLVSGEIAIVLGQADSIDSPILALLTDAQGETLEKPLVGVELDKSAITSSLNRKEHTLLIDMMGEVWPRMLEI